MSWHVLYLRPRCEKKMAEHSRLLKLDHYLPLRVETKIYQRRKVTVRKPVFPGYIFIAFDAEGRAALMKTNNIVRIMEPDRQDVFLYELDQVRKALAVDETLSSCKALKRGTVVRITSGPFMGVEGRVDNVKGIAKVRLNVDLIGQAVVVEVNREFLEIAD